MPTSHEDHRALVLAGGGANGAWEVGALRHLLHDRQERFDVVCGVSVGALNAATICHHPVGEEREAYARLERVWLSIKGNEDIYRKWAMWPLSVLWKPSVYDTSPLARLVDRELDGMAIATSGRELVVGAVELECGDYYEFPDGVHDIRDAILASAAFPAMFVPVESRGGTYVDGGVRNVTPLGAAIKAGATDITVLLPEPVGMGTVKRDKWTTIDVAKRCLQIAVNEIMEGDLKLCQARNHVDGYEQIKLRVIRPNVYVGDSFDFGPDSIRDRIALGYEDAKGAV